MAEMTGNGWKLLELAGNAWMIMTMKDKMGQLYDSLTVFCVHYNSFQHNAISKFLCQRHKLPPSYPLAKLY